MQERTAARLATEAAAFYHRQGDYTEDQANSLNTALFLHAQTLVPEDPDAIVVELRDGLPGLLAATPTHLYVLEGAPFEEDSPIARTSCRFLPLEHQGNRVREVSRFGGSHTWGHTRRTEWQFHIDDLELTIHGRTSEDNEPNAHERFAQRLAVALGWEGGGREPAALPEAA
jgi:hypothetical protein